jgi:hypothetical protein
VKLDAQWLYLSGQAADDWYNDFTSGSPDGSFFHQMSGRPWMLHQVPIGNGQHKDTAYSASTPRSGYKDILVEYLFQYESPASPAQRTKHLGGFAGAGVIGMLFGFSDDGDMPTNDLWRDDKPFFSTPVDALVKAGGYPRAAAPPTGSAAPTRPSADVIDLERRPRASARRVPPCIQRRAPSLPAGL